MLYSYLDNVYYECEADGLYDLETLKIVEIPVGLVKPFNLEEAKTLLNRNKKHVELLLDMIGSLKIGTYEYSEFKIGDFFVSKYSLIQKGLNVDYNIKYDVEIEKRNGLYDYLIIKLKNKSNNYMEWQKTNLKRLIY